MRALRFISDIITQKWIKIKHNGPSSHSSQKRQGYIRHI
jgi:hypothetical protein